MDSDFAFAIKLAKILSGREGLPHNHMHTFLNEFRAQLDNGYPSIHWETITKFLYLLTRITQKQYSDLSIQNQEVALQLACEVLEKKPECRTSTFLYKLLQMILKIILNFTIYLQKEEIITTSEYNSWQRSEMLITRLIGHLCFKEDLLSPPRHDLDEFFGAFFMDEEIPEETKTDLSSVDRATNDMNFDCIGVKAILLEDMLAYKTILPYVAEALSRNVESTDLSECLMNLLSNRASKKVDYDALQETLGKTLDSFKRWTVHLHPTNCRMTITLGRIYLGETVRPAIRQSLFGEIGKRLQENEAHFSTQGTNLYSEEQLAELCSIVIESLQQEVPTSTIRSINIPGYNKTEFTETDDAANEVCSFSRTGREYESQHWYFCYTCDLVRNKGMCSVCARKWHVGHNVVYSKNSNFFCDCGDNQGVSKCKSMPKGRGPSDSRDRLSYSRNYLSDIISIGRRHSQSSLDSRPGVQYISYNNPHVSDLAPSYFIDQPQVLPPPSPPILVENYSPSPIYEPSEPAYAPFNFQNDGLFDVDILGDSVDEEDKKEDEYEEEEKSQVKERFSPVSEEHSLSDIEEESNPIMDKFISEPVVQSEVWDLNASVPLVNLCLRILQRINTTTGDGQSTDIFATEKEVQPGNSLAHCVCSFKQFNAIHKVENKREIHEQMITHPAIKNSIVYLPALDLVIVGEGSTVFVTDGQHFRQSQNDIERAAMHVHTRHTLGFAVLGFSVNMENQRYVCVTGLRECCVLVLTKKGGHIEKKAILEMSLPNSQMIINTQWLPGRQTELAIGTKSSIRVFKLSQTIYVPAYSIQGMEENLSHFILHSANNITWILVGTSNGDVFYQNITDLNEDIYMTETATLPTTGPILSMQYLPKLNMFLVNQSEQTIMLGQMDWERMIMVNRLSVDLSVDPNLKAYGSLVHAYPLQSSDSVYLYCIGRKSFSAPIQVRITQSEMTLCSIKTQPGVVEGFAPISRNGKEYLLVYNEDGSFHTYEACIDEKLDVKVDDCLSLDLLPRTVKLPVTFFEKCIPINCQRFWGNFNLTKNEAVLTGDPIEIFGNSKTALEKLAFEGNSEINAGINSAMLADPGLINFGITLDSKSNLLAGFKVHLECGSSARLEFLNRSIKLTQEKRWYGIPLCDSEILKLHFIKTLNVRIVNTGGSGTIHLIHLELFAISKEVFKLDNYLKQLSMQSNVAKITYRQCKDWRGKLILLKHNSSEERHLASFINALVNTSLCTSEVNTLITQLILHFHMSNDTMLGTAVNSAIKQLLYNSGRECTYAALKVLCLAHFPSLYTAEKLDRLAKSWYSLFCFVLVNYPGLLDVLYGMCINQDGSNADDLAKVLIHHMVAVGNDPERLTKAYSLFSALLQHRNPEIRQRVFNASATALSRIVKLHARGIQQTEPLHIFSLQDLAGPCGKSFSEICQDLIWREGRSEEVVQYTPADITWPLFIHICNNIPINLAQADMTFKLLHKIFTLRMRSEIVNEGFLSDFQQVASQFASMLTVDAENIIMFTSFYNMLAPKVENQVHKIQFRSQFSQVLHSIHHQFSQNIGSIKATYKDRLLIDFNPARNAIDWIPVDRELSIENWDFLFPRDATNPFDESDQFLMKTILTFMTNVSLSSDIEEDAVALANLPRLLTDIINNPVLSFAKEQATQLLKNLKGDAFQQTLNVSIFDHELSILDYICESTNCFAGQYEYLDMTSFGKALKTIIETISSNPTIWREYVLSKSSVVDELIIVRRLLAVGFELQERLSSGWIAILSSIFDDGNLSYFHELITSLPKIEQDMQVEINVQWGAFLEEQLPTIINNLLLNANYKPTRLCAQALIRGLARCASEEQQQVILSNMEQFLPKLSQYGVNSLEFLCTLETLYSGKSASRIIATLCDTIEHQSKELSSHPNCEIYDTLSKLINTGDSGFFGYILENEPCVRCYEKQSMSFNPLKLQDIAAEVKYTDCCQYIKFKEALTIKEINFKLVDTRGHKFLSSLSVYINNKEVNELSDLKNNWGLWKKIQEMPIKIGNSVNLDIKFEIPFVTSQILLKYNTIDVIRSGSMDEEPRFLGSKYLTGRTKYSFLSQRAETRGEIVGVSVGQERELLPCPRCNKVVEDRHGICSCGENVYQCFKCRNINYEKLDAFICNECGVSRYGKIDIGFLAMPGTTCDRIANSTEYKQTESKIEKLLENIQGYFDKLPVIIEQMLGLVKQFKYNQDRAQYDNSTNKILSGLVQTIGATFEKEHSSWYQNMIKDVKMVLALRREIKKFRGFTISEHPCTASCYGCIFGNLQNILKFLGDLWIDDVDVRLTVVDNLLSGCLRSPVVDIRQSAREALRKIAQPCMQTTEHLFNKIFRYVSAVLELEYIPVEFVREDLMLIFDLCDCKSYVSNDTTWETTARFFWRTFFLVLEKSWVNVSVSTILITCLELLSDMISDSGIVPEVQSPELEQLQRDNPSLQIAHEPNDVSCNLFGMLFTPQASGIHSSWQSGAISFTKWIEQDSLEDQAPSFSNNWLVQLLVYSKSAKIQILSKQVLIGLADVNVEIRLQMLEALLEYLPAAVEACRQGFDYYFAALSLILGDVDNVYDYLKLLFTHVESSVLALLSKQVVGVSISLGHGLICLLQIIVGIVDTEPDVTIYMRTERQIVCSVINCFLLLRKLDSIKNKVLSESKELLGRLFDTLHIDCTIEQREYFFKECLYALFIHEADTRSFLYEQLNHIIMPEKSEPVYWLKLNKTATQEEFIRGIMDKNPYMSTDIGPLMSDVRARICKDLDLSDPEIMELLVAEQIISPELKIVDVYQKVLWPYIQETNSKYEGKSPDDFNLQDLPQMIVVYRLAGLDGEATENRIESIPAEVSDVDDEERFAIAGLVEDRHISIMLQDLRTSSMPELLTRLVKLLNSICRIHANRQLISGLDGSQILLSKLLEDLTSELSGDLILVLEMLVTDQNASFYHNEQSGIDPISHIAICLESMTEFTNQVHLTAITKILPFICYEHKDAVEYLLQFFRPNLMWGTQNFYMARWIEMMEALSPSNIQFKEHLYNSGILVSAIEKMKTEEDQALEGSLTTIFGACREHAITQQLLNSNGILEKIRALCKSTIPRIANLAERVQETILTGTASDQQARAVLQQLIASEDSERKARAEAHRQMMLAKMSQPVAVMQFEDLEEEDGLACALCQEGYTINPDKQLGFYIFVKPQTIVIDTVENIPNSGPVTIMSMVTHFTTIHKTCHDDAARADRHMRRPKLEWEGATIRNQHTRCNNWFPILGHSISENSYAISVDMMYSCFEFLDCKREGNAVHDLRLMLNRFANEESFTKDSKGGGPEYNLCAIPHMLVLVWHLLKVDSESSQELYSRFEGFLPSVTTPEQVTYYMTLAMIFLPPQEWEKQKSSILESCISVARQSKKQEEPTPLTSLDGQTASQATLSFLAAIRPLLLFLRVVDSFYKISFANIDCGWNFESAGRRIAENAKQISDETSVIYEQYKTALAWDTLVSALEALGIQRNIEDLKAEL